MAVTITRTPWIDDDGTGTTGTVINNAVKTALYNDIDGALAKVAQLAGGNAFTGVQTIAGNTTITGNLAVVGPSHQFTASLPGALVVAVQNTLAGAGARSDIRLGNDANAALLDIVSYSSTYVPTANFDQPNSSLFYQGGAGGFAFVAGVSPGAIKFFTGSTERLRITPTGEVLINTISNFGAAKLMVAGPGNTNSGVTIQNSDSGNTMGYLLCYNSAGALAGWISQTGATTVAFITSSDARLKDDLGRATDLAALRAVVVHDFTWKADGSRARGVFAQEAYDVFPSAVTKGTDETTGDGQFARPWGTDYSKFVSDLIVGWQQHDADLADLRAQLATLKGSH